MLENILLLPTGLMTAFFFLQGSFFGSFANVLIYRMQKEEPLDLLKASHCPNCSYKIPFYLNIPILSWFLLRGHCKNCGEKFSFRYPLVEFLMATLFALLFLAIGWKWFLLEALIFGFMLLVASFIDWDQMILPDSFTLSGIALGLLGAALNPERLFMPSLYGVLLGGGFLLFVSFTYYLLRKQEGMGGGDIKMLAWIGALLTWESLPFVVLISCVMGSVLGLGLMLQSNKKSLQTALPFGPFLAFSSLLYIFLEKWSVGFVAFFMPFALS